MAMACKYCPMSLRKKESEISRNHKFGAVLSVRNVDNDEINFPFHEKLKSASKVLCAFVDMMKS